MARKSGRGKLTLSAEERERLRQLSGSRTVPKREVERAQMLLRYADGADIAEIAREIKVTRATVYKCIDKALAAGGNRTERQIPSAEGTSYYTGGGWLG